MRKFNTQDIDWIEEVQPSSLAFRQKMKSILQLTENCAADVRNLNLKTGEFQITLNGKLKQCDRKWH